VYTVKVGVTDKDGVGDSATATHYIVIYDPDGGVVTGGSWIWSEAGAYQLDEVCVGAEGKANFGLVSKYEKGPTVPTGNTEFNFKAGRLNFRSSSYDWLVVTGSGYARYKGSGTINDEGAPDGTGYRFTLWAADGDPDTFRIRIWWEDGETEVAVYSNGMDQAIGGGNTVVGTK
jgi:hypothetical protein